jgi:hypothetical protein
VEVLSASAGDNSQTVTVYGRDSQGRAINEVLSLNGTTVVNGVTTFQSIDKIVVSAAHAGTITVRKATGDTAIVSIETGVLQIRRPFINVSADAAGGSERKRYEKVFIKNTNAVNALLGATISEDADPEAQIAFAVEDAVDDNGTSTDRATAPTGITGDGFSSSAKAIPGIDLAATAAIGVWLELTMPAGDPATKTTYTLKTAGSTT